MGREFFLFTIAFTALPIAETLPSLLENISAEEQIEVPRAISLFFSSKSKQIVALLSSRYKL
jgi:hypothetical protein